MMDFDGDVERGIQLFMAEQGISREEAVGRILRDWLIGHGYRPLDSREDCVHSLQETGGVEWKK